ncbi:hypothetical protein ACLSZP_10720 [Avibacterium avium]|uniref:hypothetical protein n=1 Tax=Avibacterium avium TaxID=751 RepID=UPI003BF896C5
MRKSYFLTYVSTEKEILIKETLQNKFDFTFIPHESAYLGIYYNCESLFVDKLTISNNLLPDESLQVENRNFISVIKLSFVNGKNSDKKSKYLYMKEQLDKIDFLTLFEDVIIEE